MHYQKVKWRLSQVEAQKEATRTELQHIRNSHDAKGILAYILSEIRQIENDSDPQSNLRQFTLIISALIQSARSGGLSDKQFRDLMELGAAILKINGIKPITSSMAFLYGELHLIHSQFLIKNGKTWASAWEQQVSIHLSENLSPGGPDFRYLSMALKLGRLGNYELTLEFLKKVEVKNLSELHSHQYIILKIRCLRLLRLLDEAAAMIEESQEQTEDEALLIELQWEKVCLIVMKTNDLTEIFSHVRSGKPLYRASYILEAFLFSRSHQTLNWINRLAKMTSLVQYKGLNIRDQGTLFKYCLELEAFYDAEIPFMHRLNRLGKILDKISDVSSVERKLLIWLSTTRALLRQNCYNLAAASFCEYRSLSLRLSNGTTMDALNLAPDLVSKSWSVK